jgi:hypothetical protein
MEVLLLHHTNKFYLLFVQFLQLDTWCSERLVIITSNVDILAAAWILFFPPN